MKVLLYSAVFGAYDARKSHVAQTIPIDYAFYNEENGLSLPPHLHGRHPRMIAKYYKLQPYVLPNYYEYDYVVWIDGSGTLLSPNSLEVLLGYCQKGYTVFKHNLRDCIYDEAEFCKDFEKYRDQPIEEQVSAYQDEGYPSHNGLYACCLIIRDTKKDFRMLDNAWLRENFRWGYKDQTSFPYVLWKHEISVDVIDLDVAQNDYVSFTREQWTK